MKREDIKEAAVNYDSRLVAFRAFMKGANWRINSVWHEANEKPEKSERYILIESISYDGVKCYNVICSKHYTEHPFNERWAYIEDLLPTKEGE